MSFKTAALLVGATFVLGSATAAFAKAADQQFSGQVKRIDASAKTLVVETQAGTMKEMTFALPTGVKVLKGGKDKTLAEIKVGERVRVTYTSEGAKHQAKQVVLLPKLAKAKPTAPPAAHPMPKAN